MDNKIMDRPSNFFTRELNMMFFLGCFGYFTFLHSNVIKIYHEQFQISIVMCNSKYNFVFMGNFVVERLKM